MINADAVLESIRASILAWEKAERGSPEEFAAAERMTARFAALDDHLKNRGNPPKEWLGRYPAPDPVAEFPPPAKEQMEEFRKVLRGPDNLMGTQAGSSAEPCKPECIPAGMHAVGCPNALPARRRRLLGRW